MNIRTPRLPTNVLATALDLADANNFETYIIYTWHVSRTVYIGFSIILKDRVFHGKLDYFVLYLNSRNVAYLRTTVHENNLFLFANLTASYF